MLKLDAIAARANAATPGPWEYIDDYIGVRQEPTDAHEVSKNTYQLVGVIPGECVRENDGVFIAHARTDVLTLVAKVVELEASIERIRKLHEPEVVGSNYVTDEDGGVTGVASSLWCPDCAVYVTDEPCPTMQLLEIEEKP